MSAYFIDDSISYDLPASAPVSLSALPTGKMDEGLGIALPVLARLFTGMQIYSQCTGLLRLVHHQRGLFIGRRPFTNLGGYNILIQPRDKNCANRWRPSSSLENAQSLRWAIPCHPIKTGARRF